MGFQKPVITGTPPCMGVYMKIGDPQISCHYQWENMGNQWIVAPIFLELPI